MIPRPLTPKEAAAVRAAIIARYNNGETGSLAQMKAELRDLGQATRQPPGQP